MKVGFFQFDVKFGEKVLNLSRVTDVLLQQDFDLMVLPELFTTGYLFSSREEVISFAETVPHGATTAALIEVARRNQAYIVGGIAEIDGTQVYNTAVIVGPEGYIGRHRKVHLTNFESELFDRGDNFNVFNLNGTMVGVVMCFDSWFPEACRVLTLHGAQILCHPANFGGKMSLDVIKVRALENMVYTITANRIGTEHGRDFSAEFLGKSQIVGCNGEVLKSVGAQETIAVIEIDPELARQKSNVMCHDLSKEWELYCTEIKKNID